MHDRKMTLLPKRLKCRERRMQPEEAVKIEHRLARNVDAGPHGVVLRLGMRNDDVEAIGGATLKDHDQTLRARAGFDSSEGGPGQEARNRGSTDNGESTVAKKNSTRNGHGQTSFRLSAVSNQSQLISAES